MTQNNQDPKSGEQSSIFEEARRIRAQREKSYRERALKLFPWICARCGREFGGKRLRELTVHHKDHDHNNNPPDGSNWELLCLFCHDHEHSKYLEEEWHEDSDSAASPEPTTTTTYKPFASLEDLLKREK